MQEEKEKKKWFHQLSLNLACAVFGLAGLFLFYPGPGGPLHGYYPVLGCIILTAACLTGAFWNILLLKGKRPGFPMWLRTFVLSGLFSVLLGFLFSGGNGQVWPIGKETGMLFLFLALSWMLASVLCRVVVYYALSAEAKARNLPPEEQGWTEDGYIKDQDCFGAYTYRRFPASENSCGVVAAYNLRKRCGQETTYPAVLAELEGLHLLNVPGPTRMRPLRSYLKKYLPGCREVKGKSRCLAAATASDMGILRYHEQQVPHFVSYFRAGENRFRFFNVADGLEDFTSPMDQFIAEHCVNGPVRLLWWKD